VESVSTIAAADPMRRNSKLLEIISCFGIINSIHDFMYFIDS
jgi:hypothetical protein